jgi:hypothetical protein
MEHVTLPTPHSILHPLIIRNTDIDDDGSKNTVIFSLILIWCSATDCGHKDENINVVF